ncbi:MAG: hypothetical protein K6T83_16695, partial [Alicyclobacillus sp.]|nr:hypothetical protein [Alicyclobacillus sp.]
SKLGNILAAGRPVLATADAGTALYETVTASGAGVLVPPEDGEALAAALAKMVAAGALHKYGERGRQWAEAHLSIDQIMGKFEAMLGQIMEMHAKKEQQSARHRITQGEKYDERSVSS